MKVPDDEIKRKVDWAIDILGLSEYRYRKPKNLSGGQQSPSADSRRTAKKTRKSPVRLLSACPPNHLSGGQQHDFDPSAVRPVRLSAKGPKPLIHRAFQGGQVKRGGQELLSACIKNAHIHIKNEHWRTGGQQRTGRTGRTWRTANGTKTHTIGGHPIGENSSSFFICIGRTGTPHDTRLVYLHGFPYF